MNIIIIVIPLISCYLLRFTHAVTSLLPTLGRNKIIIPCYPALPLSPLHCRCYLCEFLWLFFALLPPSYAFSFSLSILRFMQPSSPLCHTACHVRTPCPSSPASSCFVYASRFRFCFAFFSAASFCFCQFPLELILCLNLPPASLPTPAPHSPPSCCHFPLAVC